MPDEKRGPLEKEQRVVTEFGPGDSRKAAKPSGPGAIAVTEVAEDWCDAEKGNRAADHHEHIQCNGDEQTKKKIPEWIRETHNAGHQRRARTAASDKPCMRDMLIARPLHAIVKRVFSLR